MPTQTSSSPSRFLDLRSLGALAHMRFVTRQQIEGAYSGRHRSRQKGGAGEFVDFREYSAGEDLRRLDWKVLARTGKGFVRLFQDETNLLCTVVIDASGSMQFGGGRNGEGSKLQYVQYLTTALTHMIAGQQDQVGLAVVSDGLADVFPSGGTPSHVQQLQRTIEAITTRPATKLADSLRELFERLSRRGVLLVASDFLVDDLEAVFASIRLFRHRRWEVIVLHIIHPEEERLPDGLAYRFEGLEGEGQVDCTPEDIRRTYESRFAAHVASVRTLALSTGSDYRRVSTAVPYLQTLGSFLVERSG
ncbi:MAG TPA: DUF58 domain-containing protein [Tepidisphaeraceae bacterium]|jgi:uncharacterized protein (DUF58 family)|nr:DUF58 domain-containing protein [Tepidisphaeraceae bacterium]